MTSVHLPSLHAPTSPPPGNPLTPSSPLPGLSVQSGKQGGCSSPVGTAHRSARCLLCPPAEGASVGQRRLGLSGPGFFTLSSSSVVCHVLVVMRVL